MKIKKDTSKDVSFFGAVKQIRTADLFLTNKGL